MLLSELSPFCIALQETHLRPGQPYSLRGYDCYRKDDIPDLRAKGGVAIIIKADINCTTINLQTTLQAVAIRITCPIPLTICSIYLPRFDWQIEDLLNLVDQLPTPFLLLGDFNAHNPLWGSVRRDARGGIIEHLLEDENLTLLNTGASTFFNARSSDFSSIDLSIASPCLAARFTWQPLDHLYDSNHFPIAISTGTSTPQLTLPRKWRLNLASWDSFERNIQPITLTNDIEQDVTNLSNQITFAAEKSIPLSNGRPLKRAVPWWNAEVRDAIARKKTAFNRFRRYPTQENLILFKRLRAQARRITLASKRQTWSEYVSSITSETSTSEIWQKVKSISGSRPPPILPSINVNGNIVTNPRDTVEILANHFQEISSNENYDPEFLANKENREYPLNFATPENLEYNTPFSMLELETTLSQVKESAPGPDRIPYSFIKHLPQNSKETFKFI